LIAHREERRRGEGRGKCEEKGGRVCCVCVEEILVSALIRKNIENLIRKK
jgi:hypothetical protein